MNVNQLCADTIRVISAEGIQKANSGHPGLPMGTADFAFVLWNKFLKFNSKEASINLEKLLLSAIANWQAKNEDANIEDAGLFIKEIFVDSAGMLKRLRPAPQGRAHRIRKRSNHVTLVLGSKNVSN